MKRVLVPAAVLALAGVAGAGVAGMPVPASDDVPLQALPVEGATTAPLAPVVPVTVPVTDVTTTTASPSASDGPGSATTQPSARPAPTTTVDAAAARIVIADAIGDGAVASRIAAELVSGGYSDVTMARATSVRRTSAVFYNDGFEREAAQLAALMAVDEVVLHPFGAITELDERGDVWLLVGSDLA